MNETEGFIAGFGVVAALTALDEKELIAQLLAKEDVVAESMARICQRTIELVNENRQLKKTVSMLNLELGLKDVFGGETFDE